jgi:hypothetical protein
MKSLLSRFASDIRGVANHALFYQNGGVFSMFWAGFRALGG